MTASINLELGYDLTKKQGALGIGSSGAMGYSWWRDP